MRKGFLIYEEMRKYFPIYEEAVSHIWLCNCSILNFLLYEENYFYQCNYLAGRSQRTDINGNLSGELDLDISVIQGSILGPILFLCYINDFYSATTLFPVLFADDTTCLSKGKKLNELLLNVSSELQKTAIWFRANKIDSNDCNLNFNINEPGHPIDPSLISIIERIHIEGQVKHFNLLGVQFDEYLSFDAHISHLCSKISKLLFCINRSKNFVGAESLKQLYYAMIHSHLSYCLNVYSCANTTSLKKLRIKQKEAIRFISL
jgi:hypothetical protein